MYPQLELERVSGPTAVISTNYGDITVQLFPEQAPKTVENFVTLARRGYYDGVNFHRVIADFMIQGGDPTGTGDGGESAFGEPFADEFSKKLFNLRGALSMANAGPNTNGSQFFIVQNQHLSPEMNVQMEVAGYPKKVIEAYANGGTPWLDFHHTVFGQVITGMDVVDQIAACATDAQDKPQQNVTIQTVKVTD
ncbi:peptidylprolyl isomerase [Ligilactobacillus hohenheimensis]|uniref:peptidylprolyl isomerase n=1 Tax=Ligilactobacillus hohenheimensis TaxID=2991832 RepID=UPI0024BAA4CE|nr:peptidylprolyl isomerase [Ligilactobacillus hohenheimensis]